MMWRSGLPKAKATYLYVHCLDATPNLHMAIASWLSAAGAGLEPYKGRICFPDAVLPHGGKQILSFAQDDNSQKGGDFGKSPDLLHVKGD